MIFSTRSRRGSFSPPTASCAGASSSSCSSCSSRRRLLGLVDLLALLALSGAACRASSSGTRVAVGDLGRADEQRALERRVAGGLRLGEIALREVLPLRSASPRSARSPPRPSASSGRSVEEPPVRRDRARVVEQDVVADAAPARRQSSASRSPVASAASISSSSATASYSRRISCARRAASSSAASSVRRRCSPGSTVAVFGREAEANPAVAPCLLVVGLVLEDAEGVSDRVRAHSCSGGAVIHAQHDNTTRKK